jgi:hypothetical protein
LTFDGRTATTLAMLVLFAGACLLALGLPQKAAFMPLLIGVPGTILCLWQLILDLRRAPEAEAPADEKVEGAQSEAAIFLWLAAFSVAIVGFGFVLGGPLVVFAFVKFASGESWKNAIIAGLGTFAVVWGVFIWLLELPLFQGLVLEALL